MKNFLYTLSAIILFSCNNNDSGKEPADNNGLKVTNPVFINYQILKAYPHDTSSFTQGLVFYNGKLYEGTGNYGDSKLLETNLETGKAIKSHPLEAKYFGEGITIMNDTVYQLTWKENTVFTYHAGSFKPGSRYTINSEGWGITNSDSLLYVTDGSSNIYVYQPGNFALLTTISVTESGTPVGNLNELELINGYLYANQWQTPYILKINPATGIVEGKIDLTAVWQRVKNIDPAADVPNGIAFNKEDGKIYVTGKLWPELYEINFSH